MQIYMAAVGLSVLGSLGGLLAASTFLLAGDSLRSRIVPWAISYAVGTLLGVALLALLPEALEVLRPQAALGTLLAGVLTFFLLEKLVLWRHCHDGHGHECEAHTSSAASLVIIGDAFHTFVDGAIIAAAVLTSVPLGITTALAVAAHEIPQEVGDVAILLRAGYSRTRALTLNMMSAVGGVLGALAMLMTSKTRPDLQPYVLAFAAGNFLYIAMADLIPDLHRGNVEGGAFRQMALISAGILTIVLL
ncbi:MAG TPA: ZIP family metal transporter [Vicinamibacterales bacterium]|nr:ZIP family metal transporter [Vicinamibacterales bacterium]